MTAPDIIKIMQKKAKTRPTWEKTTKLVVLSLILPKVRKLNGQKIGLNKQGYSYFTSNMKV